MQEELLHFMCHESWEDEWQKRRSLRVPNLRYKNRRLWRQADLYSSRQLMQAIEFFPRFNKGNLILSDKPPNKACTGRG